MRYNSLYTILLLPLAIAACRRDEIPQTDVNLKATSIVISNGQLTFQPEGGTETLSVSAEQTFTVESQQAWCHASIDSDGVTITVDPYEGIESRFSRVDIKAGEQSQYVTVHQFGVIIQSFSVNDISLLNKENPYTKVFTYKANTSLVATSKVDWIQTTVDTDEETFQLTIDPNPEQIFREGIVEVAVGYDKKQIKVTQFDPEVTSKLTDYSLTCKDGNTDVVFDVTLEQSSDYAFRLKMANTKYAMDLVFEDVTLVGDRMEIPLGQNIGTGHKSGSRNYYVFPILTDSEVATKATSFANAVTDGFYGFKFSKTEADETTDVVGDKWIAVPENPGREAYFFHLEMWSAATHAGNSTQRLILKDMVLTEK